MNFLAILSIFEAQARLGAFIILKKVEEKMFLVSICNFKDYRPNQF
jgi:hypothetical protein